MMLSSRYIQVGTRDNGQPVLIVIQIPQITAFLHASHAMLTISRIWIINILERLVVIPIIVQNVSDAIPEEIQIKADL
jgi:hypothetical protein